MIWQNPWALAGLVAVAVPIVVHLLARRQAQRVRFPTLRFLPASPSSAVRRYRMSDLLLLVVRVAVMVASALALAQPYLATPDRDRAANSTLSRAIVIDSSASMLRPTSDKVRGIDAARSKVAQIAPSATTERIIESPQLSEAIRAASVWLGGNAGRHELVVISDFQRDALDATDLAAVPSDVGIRLVRVPVETVTLVEAQPVRVGGQTVHARATLAAESTRVTWTSTPAEAGRGGGLRVLARKTDQPLVDAALEAVTAGGVPAMLSARPVMVVFPGASDGGALMSGARPIDVAWMFDVVNRLRHDSTLADVAATAHRIPDPPGAVATPAFVVVTRDAAGNPLLLAARGESADTATLLLLSTSTSGVFPAALLGSVMRAAGETASLTELEPEKIPADVLARWERQPVAAGTRGAASRRDESDGRWLWGIALLLLALEWWMRRAKSPTVVAGIPE